MASLFIYLCFFFSFEKRYLQLFGFLSASMDIDRIHELKTLTLMYLCNTAASKSSKLITELKATLKPPGPKTLKTKHQPEQGTGQTTPEPRPSTVQTNSDPGPTDISMSDDDSGFVESSDTCVSHNEAEPGMDQRLSVPYDVDFNRNDNGGKPLCDDDTQVHLNGVTSKKNDDMFTEDALNGIDKTIKPIGLDDSAKSFDYFNDDQLRGFDNSIPDSNLNKLVDLNTVDLSDSTQLAPDVTDNSIPDSDLNKLVDLNSTQLAPDVTLKDMQTVLDMNIKDVTCNQCQDPTIHMIDELDIPFSTEMSVDTEKDKEKMAKQISVNVDVNSTPHSQIYGSQDYQKNTLINKYGQFESFSSVCDLNNDAKYTVGADGLIFGGPNILASHLDGCTKTNWKKVQVWRAEDTWSYVGGGMSVPNRSSGKEDVYELLMVENMLDVDTKKRKFDCVTGKQLH